MKFYLKKKSRGANIAGHMRSLRGLSPFIIERQINELFAVTKIFLTLICFYFLMQIRETPAFGTFGLHIELEVLSVVIQYN